jgi:outer membrane lipoprotein-sorting protein
MKKLLLFLLIGISLQADNLTGREIIYKMIASENVSSSKMSIKITQIDVKRGKEKIKVREMMRTSKWYSIGTYKSKSLLRFNKPEIIKDTGFLVWARREGGNEQWLFLPKVKSAKKIEAQEKTKSFMNTEFSYEDLESFNRPDEQYFLHGEEELNGLHCHIVEVVGHSNTQYKRRLVWIDSQDWLLRKVKFYDKSNKLLKTLHVNSYYKDNGHSLIEKMIMKNEQTSSSTMMEMTDIEYNINIPDSHFSKESLVNP